MIQGHLAQVDYIPSDNLPFLRRWRLSSLLENDEVEDGDEKNARLLRTIYPVCDLLHHLCKPFASSRIAPLSLIIVQHSAVP